MVKFYISIIPFSFVIFNSTVRNSFSSLPLIHSIIYLHLLQNHGYLILFIGCNSIVSLFVIYFVPKLIPAFDHWDFFQVTYVSLRQFPIILWTLTYFLISEYFRLILQFFCSKLRPETTSAHCYWFVIDSIQTLSADSQKILTPTYPCLHIHFCVNLSVQIIKNINSY